MNQLTKVSAFKSVLASLMLSFISFIALAQDTSSSSSVTRSSSSVTSTETIWYGEPWVWVVGAAVLIIIIVAITRSNSDKTTTNSSSGHTERVSVTKKVEREDNP